MVEPAMKVEEVRRREIVFGGLARVLITTDHGLWKNLNEILCEQVDEKTELT